MDPTGRVAIVTGGAHRVGRALSLGLARAGADVVVHYNSSEDEAIETVGEIEALGRRALAVRADLGDPRQVEAPILAASELGRLDILVNSASLFERAPVEEIDAEAWDRVLDVNLRAPFLLARAAAPLMRERPPALIVNITDLSAFQAWPRYTHHAVSKAGLAHLTRVLARALAPDIRVNAIAPGTVLPPANFRGEDHAGGSDRRLVRQEGSPGDVVDALLYLVRAEFVTGQILVTDGGRMLL